MKAKTVWQTVPSFLKLDRWISLSNPEHVYLSGTCDCRWVNVRGEIIDELRPYKGRKIIGDSDES